MLFQNIFYCAFSKKTIEDYRAVIYPFSAYMIDEGRRYFYDHLPSMLDALVQEFEDPSALVQEFDALVQEFEISIHIDHLLAISSNFQ